MTAQPVPPRPSRARRGWIAAIRRSPNQPYRRGTVLSSVGPIGLALPARRAARRPTQRQSHRRDGLPARLTSGATSSMSTSARDGRRWRRHRPPRDRDDGGRPSRSHDRPCGSLSSRVRRRAPEVVPERGRLSSSGSRAITGTRRGCYVRRAGSRRSPGRVLCRLHAFLRHLRVGFDDREPVGADPRPPSLPPCVQA